jgi:hypothetical protein
MTWMSGDTGSRATGFDFAYAIHKQNQDHSDLFTSLRAVASLSDDFKERSMF